MKQLLKPFTRIFQQCVILLSFVGLLACGSSSDDDTAPIDTGWQTGVFENESKFKNFCQTPRSGIDPFTSQAYLDKPGALLNENNWLRSWSDNTYLWFNEIVDNNPAGFTSTADYFTQLKSQATTPSGQLKDKFHFTYESEVWQQLTQSGISAGYGLKWKIIQPSSPRKAVIAYTESNTPATDANLMRGGEVVEVDGVDFINASSQADVDIINAAFFPSEIGESHTFKIKNLDQTLTTVTLTSAEITSSPVKSVLSFDTVMGKAGYMLFTSHISTSESQLIDAVNQLKSDGVNDLILDLRYNGGGLLDIASQLAYMIAGSTRTNNKTFDNLVFNSKHLSTNPVTGASLSPTPFHQQTLGFSVDEGQALPSLNLERVFILSTDNTCSASEAIINGLRGVDVEVILIGSTTCGKPYGFYATDNCGTTYFTIQFSGENEKGFGDYSDGFSPMNATGTVGELIAGCSVEDDFSHALGDESEALISAALNYSITGSCPLVSVKNNTLVNKIDNQDSMRALSPILNSIILEKKALNKRF